MPLTYTCEATVDLPRARVIELLEDHENLPKWQEGLVEFRPLTGTPGQTGATALIRQKMGSKIIEMTETVTERDGLARYCATYEAKGVWNRVDNIFSDTPEGHTRWRVETEFRCTGLMWLFAKLAPGMFRKETEKYMANFKAFAESD